MKIVIPGVASLAPTMTAITLAADPAGTNAIDTPENVAPVTRQVPNFQPGGIYMLPAYSITVLQMKP